MQVPGTAAASWHRTQIAPGSDFIMFPSVTALSAMLAERQRGFGNILDCGCSEGDHQNNVAARAMAVRSKGHGYMLEPNAARACFHGSPFHVPTCHGNSESWVQWAPVVLGMGMQIRVQEYQTWE
jgi:hypothetical protein